MSINQATKRSQDLKEKIEEVCAKLNRLSPLFPNAAYPVLKILEPIVFQHRYSNKDSIKVKLLEYIRDEKPFGEDIAEAVKDVLKDEEIRKYSNTKI